MLFIGQHPRVAETVVSRGSWIRAERGGLGYFHCSEVVLNDYGPLGVHSNTAYVAMRGGGQKRLVEAAGGAKVFMSSQLARWPGVCYSYALTSPLNC